MSVAWIQRKTAVHYSCPGSSPVFHGRYFTWWEMKIKRLTGIRITWARHSVISLVHWYWVRPFRICCATVILPYPGNRFCIVPLLFAVAGGLLMYLLVGDGPVFKEGGYRFSRMFRRKYLVQSNGIVCLRLLRPLYVGIYTFWDLCAGIWTCMRKKNHIVINIPLLSFLIIGCGASSCIAGGYLSSRQCKIGSFFIHLRLAFHLSTCLSTAAGLSLFYFAWVSLWFLIRHQFFCPCC